MALHFTNPTTYATGKPADLSQSIDQPGGPAKRWGAGYDSNRNPLGHAGVDGPVGVPEVALDVLNELIAAGTLEPAAKAVLDSLNHDGAPLTRLDLYDLFFLRYGQSTYLEAIATARGWRERMAQAGQGSTPVDPSAPYPGAPDVPTLVSWLQKRGMIMASTPSDGPLPSIMGFVRRFYEARDGAGNPLVLGVNAEAWLWATHGRRELPEQWPVREDGVALFAALERAIAEWALAEEEGATGVTELRLRSAALEAYDAFEAAFVPAPGQVAAPLTYGDRACNPRSVIYAGRFVRDAIVQGRAQAAALHCPRLVKTLGAPRVASKFDLWGFGNQTPQINDLRAILGLPRDESQAGAGAHVDGR